MKKELTKVQKYIAVIVLIFVAAIGIQFAMNSIGQQGKEDTMVKMEEQTEELEKSKAQVQVAGEVVHPGIYEAELDMRVQEVIDMAGGFTEKADRDEVNLVAYVKDGQRIEVPAIKESTSGSSKSSSSTSKKSSSSTTTKTTKTATAKPTATPTPEPTPEPTEPPQFSLNINTASVEDFASVNGISREIAEAIVSYREEYGPFGSLESLLDVPGVTLKIYNTLEPFLQI